MVASTDSPTSAELLAEAKRRAPSATLDPIIDVERVAAELGVEVRQQVDMPQSGRTMRSGGAYTVDLAAHATPTRLRFTLAHEIGHVMLDVLGLPMGEQVRLPHVETICNEFAGHLLMPPSWLRRHPDLDSMRISTISRLADEAGVSLTAAFVAVARSRRWQAVLIRLFWDIGDRRWAPLGVNTTVHPRVAVATSSETYRVLEDLRGEGTWPRLELPLRVGGLAVRLPSEVRVAKALTALVDAGPAADWIRRLGRRNARTAK